MTARLLFFGDIITKAASGQAVSSSGVVSAVDIPSAPAKIIIIKHTIIHFYFFSLIYQVLYYYYCEYDTGVPLYNIVLKFFEKEREV